MMATTPSNATLAQFGAIVMDTLNGYRHMPAWENVLVSQRGAVLAGLHGPSVDDTVRALATWAATFHAAVSISNLGYVSAEVDMGGFTVKFRELVGFGFANRLIKASVGAVLPEVVATGEQVLAGLDVLSSVGGEQS